MKIDKQMLEGLSNLLMRTDCFEILEEHQFRKKKLCQSRGFYSIKRMQLDIFQYIVRVVLWLIHLGIIAMSLLEDILYFYLVSPSC